MELINLYGLKHGDLIAFRKKGGERCKGLYYSGSGNASDSFMFLNHSNGKTQTVHLSDIQSLELLSSSS